jgi:hypothetical protein
LERGRDGGSVHQTTLARRRATILTGVTGTFGNNLGNVCILANGVNGQPAGGFVPDGVPDGYTNPIRQHTAVEFEVNKAFSKNWLMRANWRIAKIFGNVEGAFRNDNGQTDPKSGRSARSEADSFRFYSGECRQGVSNGREAPQREQGSRGRNPTPSKGDGHR